MPRTKKNPDELRKPSKKWESYEVINVLMYMKEVISNGRELDKPTARIFYERMILSLNMTDVTVSQLAYKVTKMKESYNLAEKWRRNTGAGVDSGSVQAHMNKMCENFDLLEEIYSAKTNVNPPYIYESASNDSAGVASTYSSSADFDPDDLIEYDPEEESAEPFPWEQRLIQAADGNIVHSSSNSNSFKRSPSTITSASEIAITPVNSASENSSNATINRDVGSSRVERDSRNRTTSPVREDTVSRFKRSLSTIPVTKSVKPHNFASNSSAITSDWQKQRADAIAEKNKILNEKYKRDEKWKENEQKLSEEKFTFEKDCRSKEIELKKLEIEKEEKIKKMEMEKEERLKKMEIEKEERLAKLKMEYEYKLQLQLVNRNNV